MGSFVTLPVPERPSVGDRIVTAATPYLKRAFAQVMDLILRVPMIERYRVLAAMLALEEFTQQRLADYSGVKLGTVRTVLNRERAWWLEVGREEVRRRGGRSRILRITVEGTTAIGEELARIHATVDPVTVKETPGFAWTGAGDPYLPLLQAESMLRDHLVAAATPSERNDVLATVGLGLRSAERALDRLPVAGRRHADAAYRKRLRLLSDVTARVSAGELGLEHIKDELGAPFEVSGERSHGEQRDECVYVIRPRYDTKEIVRHARQIEDKIRKAASEVGTTVLERSGELMPLVGGYNAAVFFVHSSATHEADYAFWQMLAAGRDRVVVLDVGADESLRNAVLASQAMYLSHAVTLDVSALIGTITRFRGRMRSLDHEFEMLGTSGVSVVTGDEREAATIAQPVSTW